MSLKGARLRRLEPTMIRATAPGSPSLVDLLAARVYNLYEGPLLSYRLNVARGNAICCIEEPEIHLHPRLQREFIDFITTETTNQYLISTHSPTFINAINKPDNVQVFHLRLENGATVGGPILKDEDSLQALHA